MGRCLPATRTVTALPGVMTVSVIALVIAARELTLCPRLNCREIPSAPANAPEVVLGDLTGSGPRNAPGSGNRCPLLD
jgi:hypothetical protein